MSLLNKIPVNKALKNRRIPNAFMLFVKEQKEELVKKCPAQSKAVIGAFLGKKWRAMSVAEKQVYYNKYSSLKKMNTDRSENPQLSEEGGQHDGIKDMQIDNLTLQAEPNMPKNKKNQRNVNDYIHESEETNSKKSNSEAVSESSNNSHANNGISETNSVAKKLNSKKFNKKPLNAFMLFAREQRKKLALDHPKGKQSHISRVLGDMWKELQETDKEKYFSEARRLGALHRDGLSSKINDFENKAKRRPSSKGKVNKTASKKVTKEPKERACKIFLRRSEFQSEPSKESISSERKQEAVSKLQRMETTANGDESRTSESQTAPDPSSVSLYATSSAVPSFHPGPSCSTSQPPICHCRHSTSQWLPDLNNNSVCNQQYFASGAGMYNPCYGGGLHYPFTPYQISDPTFWMYRPSFNQQPCHFSAHMSSGYPQYNCSFPYFPHPGSYFSAYFSDRCSNQFSNISRPGCPFGNASRKDDCAIEPVSSSGNISSKDDGVVTQSYSNGSNCSKKENTVVIESVTADNFSKRDDQVVEIKEDDDVSIDSHSLVIVDDDENGEARQDHDVNAD